MAKLKFNLLELTSKRVFLDKLMPSGTLSGDLMMKDSASSSSSSFNSNNTGEITLSLYDEWTNCQTRWTPGDLKDLERRVESRKAELKSVKEAVTGVKEEISNVTGHVVNLKDSVSQTQKDGSAKLAQIAQLEAEMENVQTRLNDFAERVRPLTRGLQRCGSCEDSGSVVAQVLGIRSAEELQAELNELAQKGQDTRNAIEAHNSTTTELSRLLRQHSDDLARLQTEEQRLLQVLDLKQRQKEENAEASLEELCVWYRCAIDSVTDLTRMKFEMIRPDYILVTFKTAENGSLPVHLNVDPQTGRLLAAQIGATSAAQTNSWKDLCEVAVENNDISSLLHAIQQRIQ